LQADINKQLADGVLSPVKKGTAGLSVKESQVAEYAKTLGKNGAVKAFVLNVERTV
jgi:hypothetical protein